MNAKLFESLLYRGESESLDFKVDAYAFSTDDEKGEVLKDILAFANSWRESEAYILIGVKEGKDGVPAEPLGITKSTFDDNALQQFMKDKAQTPIQFRYEEVSLNGCKCASITIPIQERPKFAVKSFGKVESNVVYIRRGSSTDKAKPDEVARMGKESSKSATFAVLIRAKFLSQLPPHARNRLEATLLNTGNRTGHEIVVEFPQEPVGAAHFSGPGDWTQRMGNKERAQISPSPLHPGQRIIVGTWQVNQSLNPTVEFTIKVYARDLPPTRIHIHFSGEEIQNAQNLVVEKTFHGVED